MPMTNDGGTDMGGPGLTRYSQLVEGGVLHTVAVRDASGAQVGVGVAFQDTTSAALLGTFLRLTDAKTAAGLPLTGEATNEGPMAISFAGPVAVVTAEADAEGTASVGSQALWETALPPSYGPGDDITVTINAAVLGSPSVDTGTTISVQARYMLPGGGSAVLNGGDAQAYSTAGEVLTFTFSGEGMQPGASLTLLVTAALAVTGGTGTGAILSIALGTPLPTLSTPPN